MRVFWKTQVRYDNDDSVEYHMLLFWNCKLKRQYLIIDE